jgi:hypothetical protein
MILKILNNNIYFTAVQVKLYLATVEALRKKEK